MISRQMFCCLINIFHLHSNCVTTALYSLYSSLLMVEGSIRLSQFHHPPTHTLNNLSFFVSNVIPTCHTCGSAAAEGGWGGDWGRDGRCQVTTGMARRRGRVVPGYSAGDGQGQFGSGLLLHGFLLASCGICHEPDDTQWEMVVVAWGGEVSVNPLTNTCCTFRKKNKKLPCSPCDHIYVSLSYQNILPVI